MLRIRSTKPLGQCTSMSRHWWTHRDRSEREYRSVRNGFHHLDFIHLTVLSCHANHTSTYATPIRFHADDLNSNPMVRRLLSEFQQRRQRIHVVHDNVDCAIIVEIAKATPRPVEGSVTAVPAVEEASRNRPSPRLR